MKDDVIYRWKNGRIIPIKVNKDKTTNDYMNKMLKESTKKMTLDDYIKNKEKEQGPLMQAFGYKPKEEKFRYKAQRLLDKLKNKKE